MKVRGALILGTASILLLSLGLGAPASARDASEPPLPTSDAPEVVDAAVEVPFNSGVSARSACPAPTEKQGSICVQLGGPQEAADLQRVEERQEAALREIGTQSVVTQPEYCYENLNLIIVRRYSACGAITGQLYVKEIINGAEVTTGTMSFLVFPYAYSSKDLGTWASQIQVSPSTQTGTAVGLRIWGTANCAGYICTPQGQSFPIQVPPIFGDADGESYYSWAGATGASAIGVGQWSINFQNALGWTSATPFTYQTPTIRCDKAVPGVTTTGCVFTIVEPWIQYPIGTTFADHVIAAQASGLKGAYASGQPLHRLVNTAVQNLNRNTACPASLPRPTGFSCDEYPFASTMEGAYLSGGGARTFPGCQTTGGTPPSTGAVGYSRCMIVNSQNTLAGAELNSVLYVPMRIINGDGFFVEFG